MRKRDYELIQCPLLAEYISKEKSINFIANCYIGTANKLNSHIQ